jgi:putative ABC transport system permease protein
MKRGLSLVLWGGIAGLVGGIGISHLIQTLLFGVSSNDPATFGMVTLLLLLVGAVASYVPAYRATRVDPVVALRQD